MTARAVIAGAAVLGTAVMLAAGYAAGGQVGLLAVVVLAAVAGLLPARLRIPPPVRRPPPRREQPTGGEFMAYRRIQSALALAQTSQRLFDHTARPLLQRLLAALLADRRRLDLTRDPQAAREAVGDDLWPLIDPARPASGDSRPPGVSKQTIARIVDRLEDL
ncbi:MAG TPA: hypothetical protein VH642_07720 [Streptosporangiaceae bacterium]